MLTITKYPSPILKQLSKQVKEISPDLLMLIKDMEESMMEHDGVGLAAPQIGMSKQIIIVNGEKENHAFFNPQIVWHGKKTETEEEGCLSLPGLFMPVKRFAQVRVSCVNKEGKQVTIAADGLPARIFQHEVDHLQGKLIINRVSPLKRLKIAKALDQIAHRGSYTPENS